MGGVGDGFGGDVQLAVVGVAVELEDMTMDDLAKGEHVEDEEEGTKHQPLRDTLGQGSGGGGAVVYTDELVSVGESEHWLQHAAGSVLPLYP